MHFVLLATLVHFLPSPSDVLMDKYQLLDNQRVQMFQLAQSRQITFPPLIAQLSSLSKHTTPTLPKIDAFSVQLALNVLWLISNQSHA